MTTKIETRIETGIETGIETEILTNLLTNNTYFNTTKSFLNDCFEGEDRIIFEKIEEFHKKYNKQPTIKELIVSLSPKEKSQLKDKLKGIIEASKTKIDTKVLFKETEKFIKLKKFKEGIVESAQYLEKDEQKFLEAFRKMEDAFKISLEDDDGIAITEIDKLNFEDEKGILPGIPSFDNMLGGGYTPGTLNCAMAPTGVGKTASMISFCCGFLKQGYDAIFVSLEQSEKEIYKRILSNLLDIDVGTISVVDKRVIQQKIDKLKQQGLGTLYVKQYPTKGLTPLQLEGVIDTVSSKYSMNNPIVFVDYLGLLKSDHMKNMDNSYAYIGSLAEELRGVAIKKKTVIFSPMQVNRSAYGNLEAGIEAVSESMKTTHTFDSAFIINQTPEMKQNKEFVINFVKNRFTGKTYSFKIKYDYNHFKFEDVFFDESKKENIQKFETGGTDTELQKISSFVNDLDGLLM